MEPQQDVEMQDAGIRRLNVKTVSGDVKRFEVAYDLPITTLKQQISTVFNVPSDRQRLIFQGKLMKDDNLLSEFVKDDDVTIHMIARAPEAPPHQEQPPLRPNPPSANVQFFGNSFNIPIEGGLGMLDNMVSSLMQNIMPSQQPIFQEPQPQRQPEHASSQFSNEGRDSGQRAREMTLPFVHVHNIGSIINQMMGPNTGFPAPRMPQLNVDRNAMVLMGGYLYNYQFQVMRLLPFLSRLADLLQRESLITDPNERAMLQTLSHNVGSGLLELSNATQPVVELFHHLQVGPNPGDFILRSQGINIVSQHQARPNIPQTQSLPNQSVPSQPIPQLPNISGLLGNLMSSMSGAGQGVQNPLSQMIPVISQILGGNGQSNMTLRSMVNQMEAEEPEQELPMNEFLYDMTIPELMGLMTGNIQAFNRIRPTAVSNLNARMQEDTTEARETIIEEYLKFINENFVFPDGFTSRMRPGFDIMQVTLDITQRGIRNVLNLVLDYEGPEFADKFKDKVMYMMGHWIDELSHNLEGGEETVNQVLTAQVNQMLQKYGAEFAVLISGMSSSIVINFFRACHQRYLSRAEMERAAQDSAQGEQTSRAVLLSSWEESMAQDDITQARMAPQRPFSTAYLSGSVYRRQNNNTQEEEKQ